MTALLRIRDITKRFGGVTAVDGVSLDLEPGEILGIVGPNGAGKSTLLSLIAGGQRPTSGEIWLGDQRIHGRRAYQVARLGIGRTFQTPRPFRRMTVRDNLRVSAAAPAWHRGDVRLPVDEILELTELTQFAGRQAGALTLLELKRLELARELALGPRLLLLDEIGAGLTPAEFARLAALLARIRQRGVALVVIEHVIQFILGIADRVAVMDQGKIKAVGTPETIAADPLVVDAYLGKRPEAAPAGAGEPAGPGGPAVPVPGSAATAVAVAPSGGAGAETSAGAPLLKVAGLSVSYGMVRAVTGVDFEIHAGEAVALLGPNGAGKSTVCKAIMGLVRPAAGTVEVDGKDVTRWPTERRVREARLVLCPEGRHVFASQTVLENLQLGAVSARDPAAETLELVFDLFPELKPRTGQLAGTLSGGQQQMLAIGRGLMGRPRVLIVDELSLGLTPEVGLRIYDRLRQMLGRGLTLILVEQYVSEALATASRAYLLERGAVVFTGSPRAILDQNLTEVYLGAAGGDANRGKPGRPATGR